MPKLTLPRIVIIAFIFYVVLTGVIMISFYSETKTLVAEQSKLSEDNHELNEKYEDLMDMIEDYKDELDKRRPEDLDHLYSD
ncbi:hypothetical protein [Robertkochia sediminum]|uniref:hypothetical protein n=1 Tax=Robertkochia sediminum TaxID=2785326 RepID=UPI001933D7F1|nr:hypothetical protein [Robertkochia sediminum]MBL7471349.1 hypothetical protein [Robertkochia sediminum]